jgi:hypothetical protein
MTGTKKRKKFGAVEHARLRARQAAGMPPPARTIRSKKRKPPKHKKKLIEDELLSE